MTSLMMLSVRSLQGYKYDDVIKSGVQPKEGHCGGATVPLFFLSSNGWPCNKVLTVFAFNLSLGSISEYIGRPSREKLGSSPLNVPRPQFERQNTYCYAKYNKINKRQSCITQAAASCPQSQENNMSR